MTRGSVPKRAAPPDLMRLVDEALERVRDPRRIWCRPALTFTTHLEMLGGALLGGAHSPLFLGGDNAADAMTRRLPAGLVLSRVRVLETPCAAGPVDRWVGFLEAVRQAQESLIVVTPEPPEPELLETFIVNTQLRNLMACAVFPGPGASAPVAAEHAALVGAGLPPSAGTRESLPLFGYAMVRRDATVLLDGSPGTEDVAIAMVHVGGRDVEDVRARMTGMLKLVTARRGSMSEKRG